jgi:hypothetical protein
VTLGPRSERRAAEWDRIDAGIARGLDVLTGAAGLGAVASGVVGDTRYAVTLALAALGLQLLRHE